jgi:hypothetical protein
VREAEDKKVEECGACLSSSLVAGVGKAKNGTLFTPNISVTVKIFEDFLQDETRPVNNFFKI